jgi:tetratricopeptide (TPR) repeat protein
MLFFVSSEYRLPVVPILCLYSARWILFMQNSLVQKNYTAAVKSLLLVALLAIPVNYQDAGARQLTLRRVDYYNFATLYQRQGNWLRAEEFFRQALRIDPNFMPARSGLAGVLARQREAGGAASVVVDPGVRRGLGLFKDGDYEAAILVFKRAIKRNGPQCQIYNNLGLSYYRLGGWEDAIHYFKLALGIDSLYVRAHYNLGLVHRRKGDEQAAQHDFANVLELDTDNDKARFQLAVLFTQMGRKMEAETHWELLLARNPRDQRLRGKIDSIRAAD